MSLDPAVWGTVFPELGRTSRSPGGILGFRVSRMRSAGWLETHLSVTSIHGGYLWQPGPNTARCLAVPNGHVAPASGCSCGFYACNRLRQLVFVLGGARMRPDCVLVGVAGSGIVRIHQRGWRAQFARILAFADEIPWGAKPGGRLAGGMARALEATYHVPVVPWNKLRGVMLESGEFVEEINEPGS